MRISDWSSDVCSSDLGLRAGCAKPRRGRADRSDPGRRAVLAGEEGFLQRGQRPCRRAHRPRSPDHGRSEEHTSELQSLMRISYAVFCLKTKTHETTAHDNTRVTTTALKRRKQE